MPSPVIATIILAGGASTRMGQPKAALPMGDDRGTVLSTGVAAHLAAGVPEVVVVAGAHPDAVRHALPGPDPRVRIVDHPGWREGQLTTLLRGLDELDRPGLEAVLVTLVDVPLVAPETIRRLIEAWQRTAAPIVRPSRGDAHGHPVIFARQVFGALRGADPAQGAKPVVRAHADDLLNVPVDDEGAFLDLDTPGDYARALDLWARRHGGGR